MKIQAGDVFCTRNPMSLGRAITAIEAFWDKDGKAEYSHAGFFVNSLTSFEALWTNKTVDFFGKYKGEKVIIAHPKKTVQKLPIFEDTKQIAICKIRKKHQGDLYPFWRLVMHMFPPLARVNLFDRPVCSELTAKYLFDIRARDTTWKGTTPDHLADEWRRWSNFEIIYEGKLE